MESIPDEVLVVVLSCIPFGERLRICLVNKRFFKLVHYPGFFINFSVHKQYRKRLDDTGLAALIQRGCFSNCHVLDVSFSTVTGSCISDFFKINTTLQQFIFNNCTQLKKNFLSDEIFCGMNSVTRIKFNSGLNYLLPKIASLDNLEILDLASSPLEDCHIAFLNTTGLIFKLKKLIVYGDWKISDGGLAKLFAKTEENKDKKFQLDTLDVKSLMKITDDGFRIICTNLFESLTSIDISHCYLITSVGFSFLSFCQNLQKIEARHLTIQDIHFIQVIESCKETLRHLDVQSNPSLSDEIITALGSCNNLEYLVLGATNITDAGLEIMSRFAFSALHTLDLTGCGNITDSGINHLCSSGNLLAVQKIDLQKTLITDQSIQGILNHFKQLVKIDATHCSFLTHRSVEMCNEIIEQQKKIYFIPKLQKLLFDQNLDKKDL